MYAYDIGCFVSVRPLYLHNEAKLWFSIVVSVTRNNSNIMQFSWSTGIVIIVPVTFTVPLLCLSPQLYRNPQSQCKKRISMDLKCYLWFNIGFLCVSYQRVLPSSHFSTLFAVLTPFYVQTLRWVPHNPKDSIFYILSTRRTPIPSVVPMEMELVIAQSVKQWNNYLNSRHRIRFFVISTKWNLFATWYTKCHHEVDNIVCVSDISSLIFNFLFLTFFTEWYFLNMAYVLT